MRELKKTQLLETGGIYGRTLLNFVEYFVKNVRSQHVEKS
jgi:hypothetical protein